MPDNFAELERWMNKEWRKPVPRTVLLRHMIGPPPERQSVISMLHEDMRNFYFREAQMRDAQKRTAENGNAESVALPLPEILRVAPLRLDLDSPSMERNDEIPPSKHEVRRTEIPDDESQEPEDDPAIEKPRRIKPDVSESIDRINANELVLYHGTDIRFDLDRHLWFVWNDGYWLEDKAKDRDGDGLHLRKLCRDVIDNLRKRRLIECRGGQDQISYILDDWKKSQGKARIAGLKYYAAIEPGIGVPMAVWDSAEHLLNTQSGVVDLRTGELRRARHADYMTHRTGVRYVPEAYSKLFSEKFLVECFPGKHAVLVPFLQRVIGYSLTGSVQEDIFVLWFSLLGRSGKSTLATALYNALGSYAGTLRFSALQKGGSRFDLATIVGKRFIIVSEVDEMTESTSEAVLKNLSGKDPVTLENKYEKSFDYFAKCKVFISTNEKPRFTGGSPIYSRMIPIKWPVSFIDTAGGVDPTIRERLTTEPEHLEAILAWAVQGAVTWYRDGLGARPELVKETTQAYRSEMDPTFDYRNERLTLGEGLSVEVEVLRADYAKWCAVKNQAPLDAYHLGRALSKYGIEAKSGRGPRRYHGVSVRLG